jgi:phage baseplate assembly protein W
MSSLYYPFKVSNGRLVVSQGLLELKQQVTYLLRTRVGERVMRQSFGLPDYVFEASTRTSIEQEVSQQILRFFSRISEVVVEAKRDDSGLLKLTLSISVGDEGAIPPFTVQLGENG